MDVMFVQLPKWRKEDVEHTSANGHIAPEEHVPLLIKPEAIVKVPEPGQCVKGLDVF